MSLASSYFEASTPGATKTDTPLRFSVPLASQLVLPSQGPMSFEDKTLAYLECLLQAQTRTEVVVLKSLSVKLEEIRRLLANAADPTAGPSRDVSGNQDGFNSGDQLEALSLPNGPSGTISGVGVEPSHIPTSRPSISLCPDPSMMSGSIATGEDVMSTAGGSGEREVTRRPVRSLTSGSLHRRSGTVKVTGSVANSRHSSLGSGAVANRLTTHWPQDLRPREVEEDDDCRRDPKAARPNLEEILRISRQEFVELMASQVQEDNRVDLKRPGESIQLLMKSAILAPNSSLRVILDVLTFMFLLYDLIVTPLLLSFGIAAELDWVAQFSVVTAIYWTFDILMSFRTGFYDQGVIELRPGLIALNYLRGPFIVDLVLVLCDYANVALLFYNDARALATVALTLRLAKIVRVFRLVEITMRVSDWAKFSRKARLAMEVMRPMFVIAWTNHLVTCGWYAIGRLNVSDSGWHWLNNSYDGSGVPISEANMAYQYSTAFHWSVSQMSPGSMQVFPQNTVERVYNILCLLLGLVFFSTLVSRVSAKTMQWSMARQEVSGRVTTLRKFLTRSKVNTPLGIRVEKQMMQQLDGTRPLVPEDIQGLKMLSLGLRNELQCELCWRHLTTHVFFKLCTQVDVMTIRSVCSKAVGWSALLRTENLFLAGHEATATYFLFAGSLLYKQHPSTARVQELTVTDVGVGNWLSEAALWSHWRHVGTIEASSIAEVMSLEAETFLEVVTGSPLLEDLMKDYAAAYYAELRAGCPMRGAWPSDLGVPNTELEDLICSMSDESRRLIGLIALESCRRGGIHKNRVVHRGAISGLEDEVNSGKSAIVPTIGKEVERVSSVTVISLQRRDGTCRKFMQLGQWQREGGIEMSLKLPGTKQNFGEMPRDSLQRVLMTKLPCLADSFYVEDMTQDVQRNKSTRFGLSTKYKRTIYHAKFNEDAFTSLPDNGQYSFREAVRITSRPPRETSTANFKMGMQPSLSKGFRTKSTTAEFESLELDIYEVRGSNCRIFYYAFLSDDDLAFLSSPMGASGLGVTLAEMAVEAENRSGSAAQSPKGSPKRLSLTSRPAIEEQMCFDSAVPTEYEQSQSGISLQVSKDVKRAAKDKVVFRQPYLQL